MSGVVRRRRKPPLWLIVLVAATLLVTAFVAGRVSQTTAPPLPDEGNEHSVASDAAIGLPSDNQPLTTLDLDTSSRDESLVYYEITVHPLAGETTHAAMLSVEVRCSTQGDSSVDMVSTGEQTTNLFLAEGGTLRGHALVAHDTEDDVECTLYGGAPFADPGRSGKSSVAASVTLNQHIEPGAHYAEIPNPQGKAILLRPGQSSVVLDGSTEAGRLPDELFATVRMTSCTVVGGSRDGGDEENLCLPEMTGREAATIRLSATLWWIDDQGATVGQETISDETTAIGWSVHHLPWSLRLSELGATQPDEATRARVTVRVDSVAGTSVVVHGDGTSGVLVSQESS